MSIELQKVVGVKVLKKEVYRSKDVAEILHVTPRTVQIWADSGVLKSWKTPGGHRRFYRQDIEEAAAILQKGESLRVNDWAANKGSAGIARLLVIEDDPALLKLYRIVMEQWDLPIKLDFASDGYEGMLKIGRDKPDILILDLCLPSIDGFRIIETLLRDTSSELMELIIISGLSYQEVEKKLNNVNDYTLMSKPVDFIKLEKKISQLSSGL